MMSLVWASHSQVRVVNQSYPMSSSIKTSKVWMISHLLECMIVTSSRNPSTLGHMIGYGYNKASSCASHPVA